MPSAFESDSDLLLADSTIISLLKQCCCGLTGNFLNLSRSFLKYLVNRFAANTFEANDRVQLKTHEECHQWHHKFYLNIIPGLREAADIAWKLLT